MKQIRSFDSANITSLRKEMEGKLAGIAKEYGLTFKIGTIRYDEGNFRATLSCGVVELVQEKKANIPNIGKRVRMNDGRIGVLVDYKPRNFKYPYIVEIGNKRYKINKLVLA